MYFKIFHVGPKNNSEQRPNSLKVTGASAHGWWIMSHGSRHDWLPVALSVAQLNQPTSEHAVHSYRHVMEGVESVVYDVVQQLGHHSPLLYNLQMLPFLSNEKACFLDELVHLQPYSPSPSSLQHRTRQAHQQTEKTRAATHTEKPEISLLWPFFKRWRVSVLFVHSVYYIIFL